MKNSKILLSLLITAVLMIGIGSWIGNGFARPSIYELNMKTGSGLLQKQNYEKALTQFKQAVKIYPDSTQARLGMAYAYIGLDDSDQAADILERAQQEALNDKEFLIECLDVISVPEPKSAYAMLKRYVEEVGEDHLSEQVQKLWEGACSMPELPKLTPAPDAYASAVEVSFNKGEIKIGHRYYFTLDGTTPDKKSFSYREPIVLSENTTINVITYNAQGKASEVQAYTYEINTSLKQKLKRIYQTAKNEIDTVEVGEEPGQVTQEAMTNLKEEVDLAAKTLNQEVLTQEDEEDAYNQLNEALIEFQAAVLPKTDKSNLEEQIKKAENLLEDEDSDSLTELKKLLQNAKSLYDDQEVTQEDIDKITEEMKTSIQDFKKLQADKKEMASYPLCVRLIWNIDVKLDFLITSPNGDSVGDGSKWSLFSGGWMNMDCEKSSTGDFCSQISWNRPPSGTYKVKIMAPEGDDTISFRLLIGTDNNFQTYSSSVVSGSTATYTFVY